MRSPYLACLLLAGLAHGQAAPPATPPAAGVKTGPASTTPGAAPESKVGPDDAVITLKNFCSDSALQGDACKTAITRAQFEKVADALQPNMSPAVRRQAATFYSKMVKMSAAAEKRGLDSGPTFQEKMALARMQILSQELSHTLQEDSAKVTDGDIEGYYKKNLAAYEQGSFARIFIPRARQIKPAAVAAKAGEKAAAKPVVAQPPTAEQQKAAEETMTKLADVLRTRAAKGEDPDKLQKEAYVAAGLPGSAPSTQMEKVRRSSLPANHQAVMDLNPGDVSQVISDPNSGHYIYKLIGKETLALDTVKPEIRNLISSQRYRDSLQSFQGDADLNEAYFGPARAPGMPPRPRGAKPSDQPAQDTD